MGDNPFMRQDTSGGRKHYAEGPLKVSISLKCYLPEYGVDEKLRCKAIICAMRKFTN